jgi:ABC-type multidrug transport system fused ATPase/permease subunit
MTTSDSVNRLRPGALVDAWRMFWFRPQPAYTLGLVRIAFGVLAVVWTLSLLPDLYEFFGEDGVAPHARLGPYRWSVFAFWSGDDAVLIGWLALLVFAVALTIGWHSRIAAIVVFVLILSFDRRNPMVFNSGDVLLRIEALFLALSPCGAALSLDQRRATGVFWSAQVRPRWPIRLMQLQLSLIYLTTVQVKMTGDAWPQGTAVSYALRLEDMLLLPIPDWLRTNALLMNAATWGTLVIELAIGILVWNRLLRPWVLAAGVVMHTMIMVTIAIGFFTPAMFVLYLAFIPPQRVRRLPETIERRVATLRRHVRETEPPSTIPESNERVEESLEASRWRHTERKLNRH